MNESGTGAGNTLQAELLLFIKCLSTTISEKQAMSLKTLPGHFDCNQDVSPMTEDQRVLALQKHYGLGI